MPRKKNDPNSNKRKYSSTLDNGSAPSSAENSTDINGGSDILGASTLTASSSSVSSDPLKSSSSSVSMSAAGLAAVTPINSIFSTYPSVSASPSLMPTPQSSAIDSTTISTAVNDPLITPPRKGRNPFERFHKAKKVACVVVKENPNGTVECAQFLPEGSELYKLVNILTPPHGKSKTELLRTPDGVHAAFNLEATTPEGTKMIASRSYRIECYSSTSVDPVIFSKHVLSPPRKQENNLGELSGKLKKLFDDDNDDESLAGMSDGFSLPSATTAISAAASAISSASNHYQSSASSSSVSSGGSGNSSSGNSDGSSSSSSSRSRSPNPAPRFDSSSAHSKDFDKEIVERNAKRLKIKGGNTITVPKKSRGTKKPRGLAKQQNQVMLRSAQDAILNYIEKNKHKYTASQLSFLRGLASQPFEWLHCFAYCLCPSHFDPQVPENLGAAPEWINTYMMVLEQVAQYFAKLYPSAVNVTSTFIMLNPPNAVNSGNNKTEEFDDNEEDDIIDRIKFEVTIAFSGNVGSKSATSLASASSLTSAASSCSSSSQSYTNATGLSNTTGLATATSTGPAVLSSASSSSTPAAPSAATATSAAVKSLPNATNVFFSGNISLMKISNEISVLTLKNACTWPSASDAPQTIYTIKSLRAGKTPTKVKTLDFGGC